MTESKVIIEPPFFELMLEISIGENLYDLHNDYLIENILLYDDHLTFIFKGDQDAIKMVFKNVELKRFTIPLSQHGEYVLDNFHRCKIEQDGDLLESFNKKNCYILEFYGEGNIELLCCEIEVKILSF